ncbi:MAG: hypothetical protein ACOVLK_02930, partial [Terrimicrobiaceae bacterium]
MKTVLDTILEDVRREVAEAKQATPPAELRLRLADAPPPRDFTTPLTTGFGLIAEIKERSPSVGPMRRENIRDAAAAYAASPLVKAVSVLTNRTHFGMDIHRLAAIRLIADAIDARMASFNQLSQQRYRYQTELRGRRPEIVKAYCDAVNAAHEGSRL